MNYLLFLIKHILDMPITIWFNFRVFDLKTAVRMPVLISHRVKVAKIHKNAVEIVTDQKLRPFMIKIGIEGVDGVSDGRKGYILLGKNGKVTFHGRASLSKSVSLRVSGSLSIGKNFYSNCNLSVICAKEISFGDDVLLGWDIRIRDCDGHPVYVNGEKTEGSKPVLIEDHVWIGAYVDILKGVIIRSGSIVAYRSCVLKPFDEPNILIGGYPAKKLKEDIEWSV